MTSGIINLCKPSGITSRDAVNVVQRLVRPAKVGHAGTLDPLASGVLVVCVGSATRLIEYIQRMHKYYRATFMLGRSSSTEDVEGQVVELDSPPIPCLDELRAAAAKLTGAILQRPPAYSAIKVAGKRAYAMARRGQTVELAPRPVEVYRLEVEHYAYPELRLAIECSGGTYVRSLGRDLAESLGSNAVMSALVRTAVGPFTVEGAVAPTALTKPALDGYLVPPLAALADLPRLALSESDARLVAAGRSIQGDTEAVETAAIDADGNLLAILVPRGVGLLGPRLNFCST